MIVRASWLVQTVERPKETDSWHPLKGILDINKSFRCQLSTVVAFPWLPFSSPLLSSLPALESRTRVALE